MTYEHALLIERLRRWAVGAIDRGQSVLSADLVQAAALIERQNRALALHEAQRARAEAEIEHGLEE